jgi:hypothetical protein
MKHRRNSEDSEYSQNDLKGKRVKTQFGFYNMSDKNVFELNDPEEENTYEETQRGIITPPSSVVNDVGSSKASVKSSISSVSLPSSGGNALLVAFAGSWADDTLPSPNEEDEGYHTDPNQPR